MGKGATNSPPCVKGETNLTGLALFASFCLCTCLPFEKRALALNTPAITQ